MILCVSNISEFAKLENKIITEIKVSIIIPVYNVEQYLTRCLDSLINQTLSDIEIICVNDGSTDNSLKILETYAQKDSRIKIINQQNKKQGAARNTGIKAAQGLFIGFVDSDDYVSPDYFEGLYNTAISENADISVASILKHKKNYDKYPVFYRTQKIATNLNDRIKLCEDNKHNFFYCYNKLYKSEIIQKNQILFPENIIYEDVIFAIKALFHANKVVSVPNIKYHYNEIIGSTINSKDKNGYKRKAHSIIYKEFIEFIHKHNIKVAERLNYFESFWITPLIKVYNGTYKKKITLFGILPICIITQK